MLSRRLSKFTVSLLILMVTAGALIAQYRRGGGRFRGSYDNVRTAREAEQNSVPTPEWKYDPEFEKDVFTFARVKYTRGYGYGYRGNDWYTDFPDSDLNLSFRLQQMTAMKVDPNGRVIELTDKELFRYPWIYIVEPGSLQFEEQEVPILRRYLLNGGFLMVDDFWGEAEWANFEEQMKRVFPEREFVELPIEHPIYHCVFPINAKLQIPAIPYGIASQYNGGITWERPDAKQVHHRAIFDDKSRIMVIAFHNTDNGDGWEREGENAYYFREFSEKIAYPIGFNVLFYAMTH